VAQAAARARPAILYHNYLSYVIFEPLTSELGQ
jgi:hypothetical protein